MAFASGKKAFGISDRSGFRYRLRDMKKEWNGLLVGPDEFEAKHPQLFPPRIGPDPQALQNPRPDTGLDAQRAVQYGFSPVGFRTIPGLIEENDLVATGQVGTVTLFFPKTLGSEATGEVGDVTVILPASVTVSVSGFASLAASVGSVTVATGTNSYGTGNKFYIDGSVSPTLTLNEGDTYWFDQSDSSNSSHPLRFSTTPNGTHNSGSEYTTGVTTTGTPGSAGSYTKITVASGAPTLYYYCTNHSGMGGQANTP